MLDIETKNFGISNPADFTRRWLAPMPGSPDGPGDRNTTTLSVADLLARSGSGAAPDARRRRQQALLL